MNYCSICNDSVNDDDHDSIQPTKIGIDTINRASSERNDNLRVNIGDYVHKTCRKTYIHKWYITHRANPTNLTSPHNTRSSQNKFDFRENCFFCGHPVTSREKNLKKASEVLSRNRDIDIAIRQQIIERNYDEWALNVLGRLEFVNELHAEDAIYHHACNSNFRTGKGVPQKYVNNEQSAQNRKRGRPRDLLTEELYSRVCLHLREKERNDEQVTVSELGIYMESLSNNSNCERYSNTYLKKRILDDFKDEVIISTINGKPDVITFVTSASKILFDFHSRKKVDDDETEKHAILNAAARIIRNDVKGIEFNSSHYPSSAEIESSNEFVPESLRYFMSKLVTYKNSVLVQQSLAQSIIQNVRPKSIISPLQIALSVTLHRHFGSRYLVDLLNKLGFCSSYSETSRFENCAAIQNNISIDCNESCFAHFVADNVDHNLNTLDGSNTFHGMGIIGCFTPGRSLFNTSFIKRITVSSQDIIKAAKVELKFFTFQHNINSTLKFKNINSVTAVDNTKILGTLWQFGWLVKPMKPIWNGFMKATHRSDFPGKSAIHFYPMIDLKASDYSCIFSTMNFISGQADLYNFTPILTFDQPLFWKATEIKSHEEKNDNFKNFVLLLGTFHSCMSFLGSIGYLMSGSGLNAVLELIYGESTVPHILSGKAYSRATRAHIIMYGVLYNLLLIKTLKIGLDEVDEEDNFIQEFKNKMINENDLNTLAEILDNFTSGEIQLDHPELNRLVSLLTDKLNQTKSLLSKNKTAMLWLLYLEMIDIFLKVTKAQRTGNWNLHLVSLKEALPFFAASGHHLYAKSLMIYLQSMQDLPITHPHIHEMFKGGYHVIRRTESYWAGVSTDLAIEQELMRSVKSTGGLTRGRGFTELQRARWVLSTPSCIDIKASLESLTTITYESSDQHKSIRAPRLKKDYEDAMKIMKYLIENNPFDQNEDLINIDTKLVANKEANCFNSKDIGNKIIKKMEGQFAFQYSFKRKDMAVIIKGPTMIKNDDGFINIDHQLLFQRLVTIAGRDQITLENALSYELSSMPAALFDKNGFMRDSNKSLLATALSNLISIYNTEIPNDIHYVIDGGSLLMTIKWKKGSSFLEICQQYVEYITNRYGVGCDVVFDGYPDGPSTKDMTHVKRRKGKTGKILKFNLKTKLCMTKDHFLTNEENKKLFLHHLISKLNESGINAIQAYGDADVLIARTALDRCNKKNVVLIGEDTDLLILLLHHFDMKTEFSIFFKSGRTDIEKKVWDIKRTKNDLPKSVVNVILPLHAYFGCDTVSRVYSIGKGDECIKKFLSSPKLENDFQLFLKDGASCEMIGDVGERIMSFLYGNREAPINKLRYQLFCKRISATRNAITPESLPPTADAVRQHSFRTYHQVCIWRGVTCNPLDWGWKLSDSLMKPVTLTCAPAPKNLLKIVCCSCKRGCNPGSNCSCRKHGLKCSMSCKECKGMSCTNCQEIDHED